MMPKSIGYEWEEDGFNIKYVERSDGLWIMIKKPVNLVPADYELNGGR